MERANKYLVFRDELLALANSPEHKDTVREAALLAGAALLKGRYDKEKEAENAAHRN
jgi:hypothetical protein